MDLVPSDRERRTHPSRSRPAPSARIAPRGHLPHRSAALLACSLVAPALALGASTRDFQYQRTLTSHGSAQACATLDPAIFAHAAPALRDLRLFRTGASATEVPFRLTLSEAQQIEPDIARIGNVVPSGNTVDFDLAMPPRPYTDVVLDLAGQNFVATADVTGRDAQDRAGTSLGQFTLFDLSARQLSRSSTLRLQESTFPLLHVRLRLWNERTGRPFAVDQNFARTLLRGATVPPSRERQTLFDTALSAIPQTDGHTTVARFHLPPRLPIERVLVRLSPNRERSPADNFLRAVRIVARTSGEDPEEVTRGTISRVHLRLAGQDLQQQQLTVNATIGANLQDPADLEVIVEDAADPPLPISAIELQARRRSLCFSAPSGPVALFYGNPDLRTPQPAPDAILVPSAHPSSAQLGPEQTNPQWRPRPTQPIAHRGEPRHLVWIVLLGLAALLGIIAIRSKRVIHH